MITTVNQLHALLVVTMTRIAQAETGIRTHLVERGTEVEMSNTKRKSESIVNHSHNMLFKTLFIGEREISPRRDRLERQKRNEYGRKRRPDELQSSAFIAQLTTHSTTLILGNNLAGTKRTSSNGRKVLH